MRDKQLTRLEKQTEMIEQINNHPVWVDSIKNCKTNKKKSRLLPEEDSSVYPHIVSHANYETATPKQVRRMVQDYKKRDKKTRQQVSKLVGKLEEGISTDRKDRNVITRNETYT